MTNECPKAGHYLLRGSDGRLHAVTLRDVRYADAGGVQLVYTVSGEGPLDIVLVPGLAGHLEYNEETPYYRAPVSRLPRVGRLIVFDRRGVGLSGGTALGPLEVQMDDIRAVMDAAGSESAAIIGCADAGPLAILFAATAPGRVDRLILWETAARSLVDQDYPIGDSPQEAEALLELIRQSWGTGEGSRTRRRRTSATKQARCRPTPGWSATSRPRTMLPPTWVDFSNLMCAMFSP